MTTTVDTLSEPVDASPAVDALLPSEEEAEKPEEPAPEKDRETRIQELVTFVQEAVYIPLDMWAVAAFLESTGLRDVDAINDFKFRHIFGLANEVNARVLELETPPPKEEKDEAAMTRWQRLKYFALYYTKGTVFAMPMVGQIAAILLLRYSLWAWLDFSVMAASLVALGTIGSFVLTGGIVQTLGRELTFYGGQKNYLLLNAVSKRMLAFGVGLSIFCMVSLIVLNLFIPYFRWSGLAIMMIYFMLLTPLWLVLAVLYALQDNLAILGATLIGTAAVHAVMSFTSWGIHASHAIGLVTANVVAVGWATLRIKRLDKDTPDKYQHSRLPRPAVLLHIIKPYLVYGTMYFLFLFIDRLIGWSASDFRQPLPIWFQTAYELGMDWALISLIFSIAVLEYTINEFSRTIIPIQKQTVCHAWEEHNTHFLRFYRRQVLMLVVIAPLSIVLTYYGIGSLRAYDDIREVRDFFSSPITFWTYWWASAGYALLALGLLNSLFFFSMAKPWVVVRCMAWAIVADVVVGFTLSRAVSFEYSVVGLTVGAGVFAALMSYRANKAFKELDYVYYSAF